MKTKALLLIPMMILTLLVFHQSTRAQVQDEYPGESLQGTWYKGSAADLQKSDMTPNPMIAEIISRVNADSIKATLRWLQNMGTRFLIAPNKKEVVNMLVQKFKSYGFSDTEVKLDSFFLLVHANIGGLVFVDSSYQYNVVCTYQGASAPGENYVVGGHYDSFCFEHSYDTAPGVDDNGTAVAATFEIARVMKMMNYHPQATIKFSLFAAEELGLFGSGYLAHQARLNNEDVRYVLNMDMIANNPDSISAVKIYRYLFFPWAGDLMADCFERYTNLDVFVPQANIPSGTDSYSYWSQGFPASSLEEIVFSPNWHKLSDTVGNCNIEYCAEITRGAFATLLEEQMNPVPQNLVAVSSKTGITLHWKDTENDKIRGYNIYRSENASTKFIRVNETGPVADSLYMDAVAETGKNFYYLVRSINDSLQESLPSSIVCGSRFAFTDTLLVVACVNGAEATPDSLRSYYNAVLDTIPFRWFESSSQHPIDLATLSRHQNVLWVINTPTSDLITDTIARYLSNFLMNGGNLMVAGFTPSHYMDLNTTYPVKTEWYTQMRNFFQADSVNRKVPCFMFRANPVSAGYDSLRVDPVKSTMASYPGEIHNLEVFSPTTESKVIYTMDSHYPVTSPLGSMKGKAVGLEYKGDDFTTILLSFPLYYLDTADARSLMKYVMKEKFSHPTAIRDLDKQGRSAMLQNYPNPFTDRTTVSFVLKEPGHVRLTVHDMTGSVVARLADRKMDAGKYAIDFLPANLPSGAYQLVLRTQGFSMMRTIVLVR